jgi:RNA polymerase-binding transcription factor DksA
MSANRGRTSSTLLERAESRLEAERHRVEHELQTLQRPVTERCPADIVDLAEAAAEREALVERVEALRMRRDALVRAEERLAEGVYGRCEVCAEPISEERLDILPATDRCVRHAPRR